MDTQIPESGELPDDIGPYRVLRLLGRGGTSAVYAAAHRQTRALVVLKVARLQTETAQARFRREIGILSSIRSAHLLPVLESGSDDGADWYATQYLEAEDWRTHAQADRRIGPDAVAREDGLRAILRILYDVAISLADLHAANVIHRDLKPENILVRADGSGQLVDLGIALIDDEDRLTATGMVVGTPLFMAPEMLTNEPVTAASDLYQWALLAYWAFTGDVPPVDGPSIRRSLLRVTEPVPSLVAAAPGVPRDLADIVDRNLARDPARRYKSAHHLIEDLAECLGPILPQLAVKTAIAPTPPLYTDNSVARSPVHRDRIGPYHVIRHLGAGGMASVYLAQNEQGGPPVAVKVMGSALSTDASFLLRFRREIDALTRVSHPSLVRILDQGCVDDVHYLVMEYVQGQSLSARIKQGPMPLEDAARVTRQLLSALEVCHNHSIYHRDIKPANVMMTANGDCKLVDFGLAKVMDRTLLTADGIRPGSPRYLPPEFIVDGSYDERSEIYQVALVLFECVTGEPAFSSTHMPQLLMEIVQNPVRLPALDGVDAPSILAFLTAALAKNPADRPSDCPAALEILTTASSAPVPPARRSRPAPFRARPAPRSHGAVKLFKRVAPERFVGRSLLLGLGLLGILAVLNKDRQSVPDPVAVTSVAGPTGTESQPAASPGGSTLKSASAQDLLAFAEEFTRFSSTDVGRLFQALSRSRGALGLADNYLMDSNSEAELRKKVDRILQGPAVTQAEDYVRLGPAVLADRHISVELHRRFQARWHGLYDLVQFQQEYLHAPIPRRLSRALSQTLSQTVTLPTDAVPLLALEFGDGGRGRGRPPLPARYHPRRVGTPEFSDDGRSVARGQRRTEYDFDLSWSGPPPRQLFLKYRVICGAPMEHLVLSLNQKDRSDRSMITCIGFNPTSCVEERVVQLDERILAGGSLNLVLRGVNPHLNTPVVGILLDYFLLLVVP